MLRLRNVFGPTELRDAADLAFASFMITGRCLNLSILWLSHLCKMGRITSRLSKAVKRILGDDVCVE